MLSDTTLFGLADRRQRCQNPQFRLGCLKEMPLLAFHAGAVPHLGGLLTCDAHLYRQIGSSQFQMIAGWLAEIFAAGPDVILTAPVG